MNMKEGTYRLLTDVKAPAPDKRKAHDWRANDVRAGTIFAVRKLPEEMGGKLVIAPQRGYSFKCLGVEDPRAANLVAALKRIDEKPSDYLYRVEWDGLALEILDKLVEKRRISGIGELEQLLDEVLTDHKTQGRGEPA